MKRAALYLRVSTSRQAEKELSIPDQRRQTAAHCLAKGWEVVGTYVEPGASATDDNRPEFQRMIEDALSGTEEIDVIVVHSFSRFFRDSYWFEHYARKLAEKGIEIVSITQVLGDCPASAPMRQKGCFEEWRILVSSE